MAKKSVVVEKTVESAMASLKAPNIPGFKIEVLGNGRWVPTEENGAGRYAIECAGCGCDVTSQGEPFRHCPWCGSKLDQAMVKSLD
ncbi:MAG: hypothetical protein RBU21_09270 [FCB group bacterium]|jgi:hypothetical protein|nr:hypothetical protein [FCB group bacterium]